VIRGYKGSENPESRQEVKGTDETRKAKRHTRVISWYRAECERRGWWRRGIGTYDYTSSCTIMVARLCETGALQAYRRRVR